MSINWSDLIANAGGSFEPLPDGDYDVAIQQSESTTSSNGKVMFKVTMVVEAGPHNGRKVWNNFVISPENPNALSFFFQHMATLGLDANFFAGNPAPEYVAQALIGRKCRITLGRRTWNGQTRNEVKKIMPQIGGIGIGGPVAAAPAGIPAPAPMAPPAPAPVPQAPPQPVAPAVAAPSAAPVPAPPTAAPVTEPAPVPAAPVAPPAPTPVAPAPPAPAPAPPQVPVSEPPVQVPQPPPPAAAPSGDGPPAIPF